MRVIPTLLWKNFGLVKGVGFDSWRLIGSVLPAVKVYNQRDVDELILVDIMAHSSPADPDYESVEEFGSECFVPLTVGGGVRSAQHVGALLRHGADKVCVNTAAYENPSLITEITRLYGAQCIVASVDVRKVENSNKWICFGEAGRKLTGKDAVDWVRELESRGAGEILITSIDRDGTMQGYDLDLVSAVSTAVSIPVIASGGAGCYQHMIDAVKQAGASAVAAASMFHFTEQTPAEAKRAMLQAGIPCRHPSNA